MAVILCNQHGRQYCVFCSPYFSTLVEHGTEPTKKLIALKLELMGAPGFFWCDEDFANSLPEQAQASSVDGTKNFIYVRNEDAAFAIYSRLVPVCRRCYEEYLEKNRLGSPETFFSSSGS